MSGVVYIPDVDFFPSNCISDIFFIANDIAMVLHTTVWDLGFGAFQKMCAYSGHF